ncbi:type IV pilus modification protein PilV [Craterilacuibacter sinensis]|nr:type IV pilus modification protein PilV [Craterilacuibacter sinensis]
MRHALLKLPLMAMPLSVALSSAKPRQRGFSLVEVLVSVIVVAFGLLGLAALNIKTLQSSHIAYQRSVASELAGNLAERMRANSGDRIYGTSGDNYLINDVVACYLPASGSGGMSGLTCPAGDLSTLAAADLADMRAYAAERLPQARIELALMVGGSIASGPVAASSCSYALPNASAVAQSCLININVRWRERPDSASETSFQYTMR